MEMSCLPLTNLQRGLVVNRRFPVFLGQTPPTLLQAAEVTVFLWQKLLMVTELLGK